MKTLLLVDDSKTVRLLGRRILDTLGFELLEAENGEDALRVVRSHPHIDAILLDWNMPVMNGLLFLKALRAEPRTFQPVVIMCTTENDLTHIVEAMNAGANEYIMKPFTDEIVREKLQIAGVL